MESPNGYVVTATFRNGRTYDCGYFDTKAAAEEHRATLEECPEELVLSYQVEIFTRRKA